MPRVKFVDVRGKQSVPIGVLCPKCKDGRLYASVESMRIAKDEPGYCDKCDYEGHEHGGFDYVALFKEDDDAS